MEAESQATLRTLRSQHEAQLGAQREEIKRELTQEVSVVAPPGAVATPLIQL